MWKTVRKRLRKLGFLGGGMTLLSICFNTVTYFYPLTHYDFIKESWAKFIFWLSIGIGGIGLILIIVALVRNDDKEKSETDQLNKIVSTLDRMDSLLTENVLIEAKKPFNLQNYLQLNNRINSEILGVDLPQVTTPEMAMLAMAKTQEKFIKEFGAGNRKKRIELLLQVMGSMSGALDSAGFGMKQFRDSGKYKRMMQNLTEDRNYVSDKELNRLIREHLSLSETFNNLRLATERSLAVKANYQNEKYGITDLMSLPLVAGISQFDGHVREQMIAIRTDIGNRIKELESTK